MDSQKQIELVSEIDFRALEILKSKSKDYGETVDVLSNFKIVSKIIKLLGVDTTTPEGYAMLMVILKIVRINNLKKENKTPENESLLDSYLDGINYFKLAYLNEIESNNQNRILKNAKS